MIKIELLADNLLLKKVEEAKSKFEVTGPTDPGTPLFIVSHAGPDAPAAVGDTVILLPATYLNQIIEGVTYLSATGKDIVGKVTNG